MSSTLDSNRLDDLQARIEDLQRAQDLRDDLSRILASDSDLERALAQVLERLGPALGADGGAFVLLKEGRQVWRTILPTTALAAERSQQATQGLFEQGLIEELVGQDARLIPDTSKEEAWQALAGTGGPRTVLSIPIQTAGSPSGILLLFSAEPNRWAQEGSSLLASIAGQAAMAIENTRLRQECDQRTEDLALINEISEASSSLHLNDVLRIVMQRIVENFQVRRCAIFLVDQQTRQVVLRAVHNPEDVLDDVRVMVSLNDRPHVAGAVETRMPIEIEDVYRDERLRSFWEKARELDIRTQLAVPLITKQRVIGAISIDRSASAPSFSKSELSLLQTIAHQAASAIENARLYQEVQRRAEHLWLANMVSHDIGTQLDIHQLLWEVVRLIRETFDCYYVTIGLLEGNEIAFRAGINYMYQAIPEIRLKLLSDQPSIAGWVARRGRPCLVRDVRDDPRYRTRPGLEDIRSQLSVPLKAREHAPSSTGAADHTIGVLDVASTQVGAFSEQDQQLLETLASQVAVAVENARLFTRVQEERATLEVLINSTDDAIVITDADDRILLFNPAACDMFGQAEVPSPGTPLAEAVDSAELWEFWRHVAQDDAYVTEIPLPDGRTLHGSITTVPEVGKVAVMQDITYLKELDRVKSEFVSTVSHDLRSPLQVIQTSAELIGRLGELNREQRREVEHIQAVVRRISDLIQNLLDIGRIEAGVGMDVEPCAIDVIIARAAGSCRALAEEKGLDFIVDVPRALPLVPCNPLRLDQVITNLVTNAIKFTTEGSVSVMARADDGWVVLEVRDTGIGIPLEDQERLFQKFYRVRSPDTHGIQGTGLGLAIVRSILEAYGGRIDVESFPRLGSTFTVRLPVWKEGGGNRDQPAAR
jgi:PAS domain S-box-containing protein